MTKVVKTVDIGALVEDCFSGLDYVAVYDPWLTSFYKEVRNLISFKDREFISYFDPIDLFKLSVEMSSLYIIGPVSVVRPSLLNDYKLIRNIPIGYLSVDSFSTAVDTIKRHEKTEKFDRSKDLIVDRQEKGQAWKNGGRMGFQEGAIESLDASRELLDREWRMIGITAHGRADVVYFPNTLLCGKSLSRAAKKRSFRSPACAKTGLCFYPNKERIRPSQLNARILFFNSCTSLTNGQGIFSEAFSLDVETAGSSKVTHLIGSPIVRDGISEQVHLLSLLLDEAVNIGHAALLSEELLVSSGRERPHLLISGDPTTTFARKPAGKIGQIETDGKSYQVDRSYYGLVTEGPRTRSSSGGVLLDEASGRTMPLYSTRIGGFALPRGQLKNGSYRSEVFSKSEIAEVMAKTLVTPFANYRYIKNLGVHPSKYEGRMKDLESEMHSAGDYFRDERSFRMAKFWNAIDRIGEKKATLDSSIHDDLVQRTTRSPVFLSEAYRHVCKRVVTEIELGACKACGGAVTKTKWEHLLHSEFSRSIFECSNCGSNADVPSALVDPDGIHPGVIAICNQETMKGAQTSVQIDVSPFLDVTQGLVSVQLMDTTRFGTEPAISKAVLPEKECNTVQIPLRIPEVIPSHHFWVRAYTVKDGNVCAFTSNLWVA